MQGVVNERGGAVEEEDASVGVLRSPELQMQKTKEIRDHSEMILALVKDSDEEEETPSNIDKNKKSTSVKRAKSNSSVDHSGGSDLPIQDNEDNDMVAFREGLMYRRQQSGAFYEEPGIAAVAARPFNASTHYCSPSRSLSVATTAREGDVEVQSIQQVDNVAVEAFAVDPAEEEQRIRLSMMEDAVAVETEPETKEPTFYKRISIVLCIAFVAAIAVVVVALMFIIEGPIPATPQETTYAPSTEAASGPLCATVRCGSSWMAASRTCGAQCLTQECPIGSCFADLPPAIDCCVESPQSWEPAIPTRVEGDKSASLCMPTRCGLTWPNANFYCGQNCKTDSDCTENDLHRCYADVTTDLECCHD